MGWQLPDPYEVGLEGIKAAIDEQIKRTARKLEFFIPKRRRLKAIIRCQDALAPHRSITTFELDEEELEVLGDLEQKRLDALIELRKSFEDQMREKEDTMQWIPVSERLPYEWQIVLITIATDDDPYTATCPALYDCDFGWRFTNNLPVDGTVDAWMPLPEPYEEVSRNA